ncbi:MAG: SulP family inorganic anion transporter [Actinomycetota bacterium]|nr:SulP family inorganic anion transporter [Actinomycetota bacterium]
MTADKPAPGPDNLIPAADEPVPVAPLAAPGRPVPPKDWLPGLVENARYDIVSGFILFLIALPLCLGIALASGAPPIAGIISGIIAGTVANLLSGSYVTINGPAAGMIVIVLGAVTELGFAGALAVGVVAGGIQILLGLARAGKLTGFFPLSVIHGMLAGIGLIIMSGQIHVALGRANPREHGFHILTAIPPSFANLVPATALVGLAAVLVMVVWPMLGGVAKILPAPLVAVIVGTGISLATGAGPLLELGEGGLLAGFTAPDFSTLLSGPAVKWIVLYVFVASLESLLTAEAVDKLDPWQRRANMNKELIGKGAGNVVSSAVGGLPMIAEVVRSKANILNGARTRWSNFFHGVFLGVFVLAAPGLLELIPLAALAGILLVIGFKLAHPNEFLHAWHIGKVDFALMLITAFTVLLTDLLIGVATGIVLGLIWAVVRGTSIGNLFKPSFTVTEGDDHINIELRKALGFHNFIPLRSTLDNLPPGRTVTLDFTGVHYIDPTVMERLRDFELGYTADGGTVRRVGDERLTTASHHEFATRTAPKTSAQA